MNDKDQSLEDRMIEQIHNCLYNGEYARVGKDTTGKSIVYCSYFFLETRREPVDCKYRGERMNVVKSCALGEIVMEFYKCNRWNKRK